MSRQLRSSKQKISSSKNIYEVLQKESCELVEHDHYVDVSFVPDADNSDIESEFDGDSEIENFSDDVDADDENFNRIQNILSYKQIMNQYSITQKKLQEDHVYSWVIGEKIYDDIPSNQYLLKDSDQKRIQNMTPVELFEICFSSEIKNYILQATSENNFRISMKELSTFIGILVLSNFNQRRAIKDY